MNLGSGPCSRNGSQNGLNVAELAGKMPENVTG